MGQCRNNIQRILFCANTTRDDLCPVLQLIFLAKGASSVFLRHADGKVLSLSTVFCKERLRKHCHNRRLKTGTSATIR